MPQNFVLELPVRNGSASRGDYILWEGSAYLVTDLDKNTKTLEIKPIGKTTATEAKTLIISANRSYRIRLEFENNAKCYDGSGHEIKLGNIVTYAKDLASRWEIVGLSPESNDVYIYSRETLEEKLNTETILVNPKQLHTIPSLNDKYGNLLYYDDTVLFDKENYRIGQLDTRCKILQLIHLKTGKQEIVSPSAVELVIDDKNNKWN
jgi:hypothetical protein